MKKKYYPIPIMKNAILLSGVHFSMNSFLSVYFLKSLLVATDKNITTTHQDNLTGINHQCFL
ncbi:hypothetical protein EG351_16135 [Chryseobacterium bernardetii]|nr:hypothetical protein EG351_16135 [Chryseobacterium bernardetii]